MDEIEAKAVDIFNRVERVPRLSAILDPLRYSFLSFYPRWEVLPELRTNQFPKHPGGPLALYIHIPFCKTICPGCQFSTKKAGDTFKNDIV